MVLFALLHGYPGEHGRIAVKIALVRHAMDEPQGGARLIALLARDLRDLGERVTLYCHEYDPERCFPSLLRDIDVRCVRLLVGRASGRASHEFGRRRAWLQLRRYFVEARAIAAIIDRDVTIVNPHEWLAHRSAAIFSARHGTPVVWTYNDPSSWHLPPGRGLKGRLINLLGRYDTRQVNRFSAVATLSSSVSAIAADAFKAPIQLVRCGIDAVAARRSSASRRRPHPRALRILSVGILSPPRRLEDALRGVAFARDRGVACRYTVIGSDRFWPDYGGRLRTLAAQLGIENIVEFRFGSVSEQELEAAYDQADIAVFPNEQQAWGLAQLEAMARGIPTILSRGAGVSEVVADGLHAFVIDPRRPDQIADCILRMASDPGLQERVGGAGRQLVLEMHTSRHYALRMRELYRACVDGALQPALELSV